MDPKVKNLLIWVIQCLTGLSIYGWFHLTYLSSDPLTAFAQFVLLIATWRALLSFYRRCILPPKHPRQYGKWAVVTGCTDGIGKAYVDYLAAEGLNIVLISRSEDKLIAQKGELEKLHGAEDEDGEKFKYIPFDFTTKGEEAESFFNQIEQVYEVLQSKGRLGVLVNNVGITNAHPMELIEFDDKFVDEIAGAPLQPGDNILD